ncbi:c-type cytochrome [Aestuariivirga sp.]|uniref:c-type cytochrome n=1 Tax=Aestuariivirga sp. TaxID=2650926 RepID=UPI0025C4C6E2|nr:c-type cytochrome [Aestuariivirga sp.]MCA3554055.1 cytochrome C [Aestuariivirga sp.]
MRPLPALLNLALLSLALLSLALPAAPAAADGASGQGKADFGKLCAPCHGIDGKGGGPQAPHLARKPADLTMVTRKYGAFPGEKVFGTIAGLDMPDGHGTREMPVWGDVFVTEEVGKSTRVADAMKASGEASRRIAGLVSYVQSIQAP